MQHFLKNFINKNTTLFLDRDGVINIEKENDYIRNLHELKFYDDVLENIKYISNKINRIIVVTNQRGIGKGLMTTHDLREIHNELNYFFNIHDANIDAFYFAPELESDAVNRKPNIGMALQAKKDFPEIEFTNSIMVGNNLSDMEFGKNIGAKTIYIETTKKLEMPNSLVDFKFDTFAAFCKLFNY